MSGVISDNTVRSSGVVAPLSSATLDSSNPATNTNPEAVGTKWINTTSGQIFICIRDTTDNNAWVGQADTAIGGGRAVYGGGVGGADNVIDYYTIITPGNATDFGNLTQARYYMAACSNGSNGRGVFGPGYKDGAAYNNMDYITIDTPGDATDFGDFTTGTSYGYGSCSNGTNDRGVFWGGTDGPSLSDKLRNIQYITITNTSGTVDFGDMSNTSSTAYRVGCGAASNGTSERGVVVGGFGGGTTNAAAVNIQDIQYMTISTTGDASIFGDITFGATRNAAPLSNGTQDRVVYGGGTTTTPAFDPQPAIEYITITSLGDGTDFGDLLSPTSFGPGGGNSNGSGQRGLWQGDGTNTTTYITINTTGDSLDFGDLTVARNGGGALSNQVD